MRTLDADRPVVAIGSSGLDIVGRAAEVLHMGTSNPAALRMSPGGVARNVAENLARLGTDVYLISAVGDDPEGQLVLAQAAEAGVHTDTVLTVPGSRTGAYLAVLDEQGNLQLAMDDMRIVEAVTPDHLRACRSLIENASVVFIDGNLTPRSLALVVRLAQHAGVPVAADPTSVSLAPRFADLLDDLWLFMPNEAEASALVPHPLPHADRVRALDAAHHLVSRGVEVAVITMAEFGVAYASPEVSGLVPAVQTVVLDPTGAGDAQTAAVVFALLNDIPLDEAVRLGASAAALTLRTPGSVVPDLSIELLYDQLR
jgi:pseudouridine kinase